MDAVKKYHETAKEYRSSLVAAWEAYDKGYKNLERYKGGRDYDKELTALQDKRDEAIRAAQAKARQSFKVITDYMRRAIEAQPVKAPTTAQMNVLTALKMRETVEGDEIIKAAEQMRGVDVAVKVLDELAFKNGKPGIVTEYMGATGRAERGVNELISSANLLLTLTRPNGWEQRAKAHHATKWGGDFDERHAGVKMYDDSSRLVLSTVDKDFKDERETMRELGGIKDYAEFRSVVNRDPMIKAGLQEAWGEV